MVKEGEFDVIKREIERFVGERGWERYHTPKEIALSLAAEVGELLREFQWMEGEEEEEIKRGGVRRERIVDEMADVLFYLVDLSRVMNVDLMEAFLKKMEKNREKYPPERFQGNYERP